MHIKNSCASLPCNERLFYNPPFYPKAYKTLPTFIEGSGKLWCSSLLCASARERRRFCKASRSCTSPFVCFLAGFIHSFVDIDDIRWPNPSSPDSDQQRTWRLLYENNVTIYIRSNVPPNDPPGILTTFIRDKVSERHI